MTIQLPPLKSPSGTGPHAVPPEDALSSAGGLRHTALGRGDRAPRTTSANDGYHRAAPPRNLGIRTGQRPTIHRLHQCRGPKGPRASVTTARGRRAVSSFNPMLRRAAAPVPAAVAHEGPTCQQSQRDSLPGREEERTPKGCERARGRDSPIWGGLPTLAFTYTLRPSLDAPLARKRSTVPSRMPGGPLCMGWSVRLSVLPYKVGHPGSPPTRAGRDLGLVRRGASCWLGPPWAALKAWGGGALPWAPSAAFGPR